MHAHSRWGMTSQSNLKGYYLNTWKKKLNIWWIIEILTRLRLLMSRHHEGGAFGCLCVCVSVCVMLLPDTPVRCTYWDFVRPQHVAFKTASDSDNAASDKMVSEKTVSHKKLSIRQHSFRQGDIRQNCVKQYGIRQNCVQYLSNLNLPTTNIWVNYLIRAEWACHE